MVISTVHNTNEGAIKAVSELYGDIEADVTFSSGKFWRGVGYEPEFKSDIQSQTRGDVLVADSRNIPLRDNAVRSIMFDPPFIVAHGRKSIIGNRFGSYKTMKALWNFYDESMIELQRVVEEGGFIVWKCQDTVSGGRQMLSHVHIINQAFTQGLYVRDIFILLAKSRMKTHNTTIQYHARKFHSYFLVLEKGKKPNLL